MEKYAFPLCIQLTMPLSLDDPDFAETMELLKKQGFYGVELNVWDFEQIHPNDLKEYLDRYGLKMTMLATGVYAKKKGLSLGSPEETIRKESVRELCETLVPFAEEMGCDLICGFIKGADQASTASLQKSVNEVNERCSGIKSKIYLEATNHYESGVINRVQDGAEMISGVWGVLPDTYHMNMEETGMLGVLAQYQSLYQNLHVSDNNRYFPGFGAIDFYQILFLLKSLGWKGTIAIEGRDHGNLREDILRSSRYLEEISARL